MFGKSLKVFSVALGVMLFAGSAFADAIDGDWCHSDGRRMSIRGTAIVTPGGKQMEGDYSRHAFNYVVPTPERDAGKTVFMTLLDENHVHLRLGDASAANPETWVRCSPSISGLELLRRS
jgi:hypothetical protein